MDTARVIQVIETTLTRRGDGKSDPIRVITQYWSMDGTLLAEVDPVPAGQTPTGSPYGGCSISGHRGPDGRCEQCDVPLSEMHRCAGCRRQRFTQHVEGCLYGSEGVSDEAIRVSHMQPVGLPSSR